MRVIASTALAAVALGLAGCAPQGLRNGLETVHQPVVERATYVLDLNSGAGGLAPSEAERLVGWLDALRLGYGDRISVDSGAGYGGTAATRDVATIAAQYGVLLSEGAPVTAGVVTPGTVRVVVTRASASVPGCPDWSSYSDTDFTGSTHSNFGCGTNSTLAAMVADPEDLVSGRKVGPGQPTRSDKGLKAIEAYRSRASSAGQVTKSGTGGN